MEAYEQLCQLINDQKRSVRASCAAGREGVIALTRMVDASLVEPSLYDFDDVPAISQLKMYARGFPKALSLFLDETSREADYPSFAMGNEECHWAHETLLACGRISLSETYVSLSQSGLARISVGDNGIFQISIPSKGVGLEAMEAEDFVWYRQKIFQHQSSEQERLDQEQRSIYAAMADNIATLGSDFIRYSSTDSIDDWAVDKAVLTFQRMIGGDSFPSGAKFGGITYEDILAGFVVLLSYALKHIGFCNTQFLKAPATVPANIVTMRFHDKELIEYLAADLRIDFDTSERIIGSITLNADNVAAHCGRPGAPFPPVIRVGSDSVICSPAGFLVNPLVFQNRELKRTYGHDFFDAVNKRESVFREQLYSLFKGDHLITSPQGIVLRLDNAVSTDIDAVMFDPLSNILGLFQLKWHDTFGDNEAERRSRQANFMVKANQWVERVYQHLQRWGTERILKSMKVKARIAPDNIAVRVFVLGRNFAHFSGQQPDPRAASGTWYQTLRIASALGPALQSNPIDVFYQRLQDDSPMLRPTPQISPDEYELGGKRIQVVMVDKNE